MAANKFATMLHRNTNKITIILIYAVLEWILIGLLLLNSLFSHLIIKFAHFFGLKPPCLWCTRLDHIFDPAKANKNMNRDLLCEAHAKEISRLEYCSNHHKLAESQEMCEDCSSSRRTDEFLGSSKDLLSVLPWMKGGFDGREKVGENGNCSCCGVSLDSKSTYSSYILLKTSSWDVLECAHKENLITGSYDCDVHEGCDFDKTKVSDFAADLSSDHKGFEDKSESQMLCESDEKMEVERKENDPEDDENVDMKQQKKLDENSNLDVNDKSVQESVEEDAHLQITPQQHLEFFLDYSGHKLVPIELIDSLTEESQSKCNVKIEDGGTGKDMDQGSVMDCSSHTQEKEDFAMEDRSRLMEMDGVLDLDINEEPKFAVLDAMEIEEDELSLVFHAKDWKMEMDGFANFEDVQEMTRAAQEKASDVLKDCEDIAALTEYNENEADVSIGTDIPDLDITDEVKIQESDHSHECTRGDPSTSCADVYEADDKGPVKVEEQEVELQCFAIQDRNLTSNYEPSSHPELNENSEDKVPDKPKSVVDSPNHKKSLFLEKSDSAAEESLDGSVTSELEGGDGLITIEQLKSALRAERRALHALYAELEEERSASAVAANQTMAMINRLQEEKAAMQMEALQYQRMMEEQSEYDQEALQLLNELMVKREKEKQELEKELEVYRKKLLDYETKEKIRALKKTSGSGFSSASCSNAEDSDGLSIDLNQEAKEDEQSYSHENTPVDVVVNLEESLADFEEERLSILSQLKVLEEKLMALDEENGNHFEDVTEMDGFYENGHVNGDTITNGHPNGFLNGQSHKQSRIAGQRGKSLLPLFDAMSGENGDLMLHGNGNGNGFESNELYDASKFEMENKKLVIEEEVDHLYERLQALEADKEFLKHCVGSLKKGDKGMDLLQEILQHLRDLRHVELRARNF